MDYLNAAGNFFIDSPPEVLIGGVFMALVVALATAALYRMVRRRSPEENPTVMAGMIVAANLVSMILAVGYVSHKYAAEEGLFRAAQVGPVGPRSAIMPYGGEQDPSPLEHRRAGRSSRAWSRWERPRTASEEANRTRDSQTSDHSIPRPSTPSSEIPDIANHS
jgi:hypothetical protein